jgi:PAS domain S-box-containing protein
MCKRLSILIVEDSESDTELIIRQFQKANYDITYERVETDDQMIAAIEKRSWDLVIADYFLPEFNAPAALAILQKSGLDIPFVVVSGAIGEETAIEIMKAGAHDYIMKNNMSRLVPAIERELKEAESRVQRKQAEELLRSEHIMLARTEGIAHIGSWGWNIAMDTVNWSDELFRIFQRDPREGAPSFAEHPAFYHPDDMARLQQAVKAAVADGTPYKLELRAIRKDGETRVCVARGVAEMALGGRPVRLFGSLQDVTELKRAEEELRKSEENFRLSLDDSPLGVRIVTMEGETLYANQATLKIYGYARIEELKRTPIKERYTPESYAEFKTRKEKRERGEVGPSEYEISIVRKNGEVRHIQVFRKEIWWNGARQFQVIYQDITDRKRVEVELQKTLDSLKKAVSANIQIMVSAVEMRDPYTAGHQIRSANLACVVATEMGLPQDKIDGLRMASSIHDIGKLSIPAEILSKPTKLTDIEFSLIKEHSQSGYEMLKNVESPWPLAQIVYQHHERMNGSGYPRNLKGDEILIEARIMAVADVVEAMASHRPYRSALGIEAALEEIEKNKGILYDNDVAVACLRLFREKGYELIAQKITGTV